MVNAKLEPSTSTTASKQSDSCILASSSHVKDTPLESLIDVENSKSGNSSSICLNDGLGIIDDTPESAHRSLTFDAMEEGSSVASLEALSTDTLDLGALVQVEVPKETAAGISAKEPGKRTTKTPATKGKKKKLTVNTTNCKYDIVRQCTTEHGLRIVGDSEPWSLFWIDTGVSVQRVLEMEPYQKINHFPGMHEICRKDHLARNLGRLSRILPTEYTFFPKTFVLPHDWPDLKRALKAKSHHNFPGFKASNSSGGKRRPTWIAKPDHGCQGKGIFLFRSLKAITPYKDSRMIVQLYLNRPCLIDEFKFDLRIYVLVTSVDPLRIFVHRDGLARFATERYVDPTDSNMDDVCMHLTNYAINKHNPNFDTTESDHQGSKRTLQSVFNHLVAKNAIPCAEDLWMRIHDAIVKTVVTIQPQLSMILKACFPSSSLSSAGGGGTANVVGGSTAGSPCFEILGFDIFLDRSLKPWVLEVNHSPSFTCDSGLDFSVKRAVIGDTLGLLNLNLKLQRRFEKGEKEKIRSRLFGECGKAGGTGREGAVKRINSACGSGTGSASRGGVGGSSGSSRLGDSGSTSTGLYTSKASSISLGKESAAGSSSSSNLVLDSVDSYYSNFPAGALDSLKAFEDSHLGNFKRAFPPACRNRMERYLSCLAGARRCAGGVGGYETAAAKGRSVALKREALEKEEAARQVARWRDRVERGIARDDGDGGGSKKITSKLMEWRRVPKEETDIPQMDVRGMDSPVGDEYSFLVNASMMVPGTPSGNPAALSRIFLGNGKLRNSTPTSNPESVKIQVHPVETWISKDAATTRSNQSIHLRKHALTIPPRKKNILAANHGSRQASVQNLHLPAGIGVGDATLTHSFDAFAKMVAAGAGASGFRRQSVKTDRKHSQNARVFRADGAVEAGAVVGRALSAAAAYRNTPLANALAPASQAQRKRHA
ncbi:Tubulin polyglutamylase ttll6 [Chytriomyces hyalinus]|nr:Tubulin polyglutamylase ttll6 [Chytriomyces hyalinus]